jgi:tRNA nucleotidyltransferase (CCA-adding enzyme)
MLDNIVKAIVEAGGRPYLGGGAVRDQLLGLEPNDIDIEVFGLAADKLAAVLIPFGAVKPVGVSFGVLKLRAGDAEYDFSLPRRENKVGRGHKGFQVELDATMTPQKAAARRHYTIGSIARDLVTGKLLDFYGGQKDLERRILRATSEHFGEDPLRVLIGMQFAGRFGMMVDEETAGLCRSLRDEYLTLAKERVWDEWTKWATKSTKPSFGLAFLRDTGWDAWYPELAALEGLEQDAEYHPEGCVFTHTMHAVDQAAQIADGQGLTGDDRTVLIFAALCHDFGKASTTEDHGGGRITSYGHDRAGEGPSRSFLAGIGAPAGIIERVVPLVKEHMAHLNPPTTKSVRRLATRLAPASIKELLWVIQADHSARPPLCGGMPESARALRDIAEALRVESEPPAPMVMGRQLIAWGLKPSREFRPILDRAFQMQLEGDFQTVAEARALLNL